jgi:hypothetical protein
VVVFALVLGAASWLLPVAEAQVQFLQPPPGEEAMLSRMEDKLKGPENTRLSELRHGKRPVVDAAAKETEENREILKKAARFYAYQITNPLYHTNNPANPTMNDLVNQAYDKILLMPEIRSKRPIKDEQKGYLKEFSKEMHLCLRDVLAKNGKPIVRVNATRILAGLTEAGQEDVADTLVSIIKNPNESEAVKFWAFKGLKELFELGTPGKSAFQDPKREIACIACLNEYVGRPRPKGLAAEPPADELAGYQYVRREAIRALAHTRYPIVPNVKGPDGLTALWLQRAVASKGIDPETSLTERAEASIGLCRLQVALNKAYNLDQAASQVGAFLLDYIKAYNDQRPTRNTSLPWKLYTVRILVALEELDNQAKGSPAAAYVSAFVTVAKKTLRDIEVDKESANADELDKFLRSNAPTNKELLKGVSEATLKTGAP